MTFDPNAYDPSSNAGRNALWRTSIDGMLAAYSNLSYQLRMLGRGYAVPVLPQQPWPKTQDSVMAWKSVLYNIFDQMIEQIEQAQRPQRNTQPLSKLEHSGTVFGRAPEPEKPKVSPV